MDEPQRAARLGFLEDRAAVVGREGDGRRIQRLDEDREGVLLRRAPLVGRHVLVVHIDGHLVLAGLGERVEDVLRLIGVALQYLLIRNRLSAAVPDLDDRAETGIRKVDLA